MAFMEWLRIAENVRNHVPLLPEMVSSKLGRHFYNARFKLEFVFSKCDKKDLLFQHLFMAHLLLEVLI